MQLQAPSGLMGLPNELKSSITSFLSDSDLAILCHLMFGSYIHLILDSSRNQATIAVLNSLTPKRLVEFRLSGFLDVNCFGELVIKQNCLEHLSFRHCWHYFSPTFAETPTFPSLKTLSLYNVHLTDAVPPEGENSIGLIVQNAPKLACLQYTCPRAQRRQNLLEGVLRYRNKGSIHSQLRLQSLMLHGQDLSLETLLVAIISGVDFSWIRTLYLRRCPFASKFLATVSRENNLLLKTFVFVQHVDDTLPHSTLPAFLRSFSGLEHMCIDLNENQPLPAIEDFENHAGTLVTLIVGHNRNFVSPAYSLPEIAHLCESLRQLQRLAVHCPVLEYPTNLNGDLIPQAGMTEFLKSVATLPSLKTLRITNLLNIGPKVRSFVDVPDFGLCLDQYVNTLESLATQCFRYLVQIQKTSKVD
ncbi:uncharacterized protein BDZ99DRAFT_497546 [Mytilinidion resinicola]|uniref:F-box domain-containing protein n=1 Tax=Mytilinidion resinicola TaxID=574789 RepID=A0A6A6YU69_9PEZI|nr:uncharacterized protein BDZ99DRAFT_497546 [Mytilinidion resinicola]KAF2811933.1 hypothetical protein BDZ99DRAFT_497546 [Mytilinidion resinicola]